MSHLDSGPCVSPPEQRASSTPCFHVDLLHLQRKTGCSPMPLSPVWWGLKCHWFLLPLCARLAWSGDRGFWCLKYEPGRRMFLTVKDCFLAAWLSKSLMQFGKLFPGTPVKLSFPPKVVKAQIDGRGREKNRKLLAWTHMLYMLYTLLILCLLVTHNSVVLAEA